MKKALFTTVLIISSMLLSAQSDSLMNIKPLKIWVYMKDNKELQGVLTGYTPTSLQVYIGSRSELKKDNSPQFQSIGYGNIDLVKTKKYNGLIKGLLIGGAIGLFPVVFGEGGAYVAIISFPVGIITGSIVGATSKKKYQINGDLDTFNKFTIKLKRKIT